jgi:hypothetical protein
MSVACWLSGRQRSNPKGPLSSPAGLRIIQVWRYLYGRTPPGPGRRGHVLDRARTRQTKSPPVAPAGSDCSALSAGRSAKMIENGSCKPALKPIARGEVLNPVPSRPVNVMATAIVRVHRRSRDSCFRVARHGGANNSRSMMSSVSVIVTVSLGERRGTKHSESRQRNQE